MSSSIKPCVIDLEKEKRNYFEKKFNEEIDIMRKAVDYILEYEPSVYIDPVEWKKYKSKTDKAYDKEVGDYMYKSAQSGLLVKISGHIDRKSKHSIIEYCQKLAKDIDGKEFYLTEHNLPEPSRGFSPETFVSDSISKSAYGKSLQIDKGNSRIGLSEKNGYISVSQTDSSVDFLDFEIKVTDGKLKKYKRIYATHKYVVGTGGHQNKQIDEIVRNSERATFIDKDECFVALLDGNRWLHPHKNHQTYGNSDVMQYLKNKYANVENIIISSSEDFVNDYLGGIGA